MRIILSREGKTLSMLWVSGMVSKPQTLEYRKTNSRSEVSIYLGLNLGSRRLNDPHTDTRSINWRGSSSY